MCQRRCQMGHDIAPGASYCAQGHPIALDAMQFAQDAYGAPPGGGGGYGAAPQGYGAQPQQQQYGQAYGAPQPSPQPIGGAGFGGPAFGGDPGYAGGGGYGQPQAPQAQPLNPAFNPQGVPPQGYGQPPQQQQAYGGAPPPQQQQQAYGAPQAQPAQGQPMFNQPVQQSSPPAGAAGAMQASPDPTAGANMTKALRGFIVTYQTNTNGDFWALTGGRHVVGRAGSGETVDIPLADPTISSKHAVVAVDGSAGTVSLEDTGSTNGTFVNDEHLGFNGRRDLRDGDRVRFGGFTTIVKIVGRA